MQWFFSAPLRFRRAIIAAVAHGKVGLGTNRARPHLSTDRRTIISLIIKP